MTEREKMLSGRLYDPSDQELAGLRQRAFRLVEQFNRLQKEDAAQSETKSFLDKVYGGRLGLMMSAMVDSQTLTQEDIDELTAILENAKEGEK